MEQLMKAGVVHAPFDIRYEDINRPTPGKDQVLVKVKYTGICGSDIPRVNGNACHFYPNILGHEFSGVIAEIGADVTNVTPGDRVSGIPLIPCMKCEDCQKGDYSLCKHYSFVGSREFGSFAEYVVVPAANVAKFEDSVSFEQGAFFEPATVALHGLQRVPFQGGKSVAILGGGTIGMFVMQWANIFGAKDTGFDQFFDIEIFFCLDYILRMRMCLWMFCHKNRTAILVGEDRCLKSTYLPGYITCSLLVQTYKRS